MDFHLTNEQLMLRKMVRAGKLGIKTGEGFFNYKK